MEGKTIRDKLVGSDEERAVSPVIGVILMVSITVILAAVIAAFVLDMGDELGDGSVNAAVETDVSNSESEITFTLVDEGSAENFVVRGTGAEGYDEDLNHDATNASGGKATLYFSGTGTTDTLAYDSESDEDDNTPDEDYDVLGEEGELTIVAIDGNTESIVGDVEWNFSDD